MFDVRDRHLELANRVYIQYKYICVLSTECLHTHTHTQSILLIKGADCVRLYRTKKDKLTKPTTDPLRVGWLSTDSRHMFGHMFVACVRSVGVWGGYLCGVKHNRTH